MADEKEEEKSILENGNSKHAKTRNYHYNFENIRGVGSFFNNHPIRKVETPNNFLLEKDQLLNQVPQNGNEVSYINICDVIGNVISEEKIQMCETFWFFGEDIPLKTKTKIRAHPTTPLLEITTTITKTTKTEPNRSPTKFSTLQHSLHEIYQKCSELLGKLGEHPSNKAIIYFVNSFNDSLNRFAKDNTNVIFRPEDYKKLIKSLEGTDKRLEELEYYIVLKNKETLMADDYSKLKSEIMDIVSEEFSKTKDDIISVMIENNKLKKQEAELVNSLPPLPPTSFIKIEHSTATTTSNIDDFLPLPPPPPLQQQQNEEQIQEQTEEYIEQPENYTQDESDDYYKTVHPLGIQDTYEDEEYFSSYSKISLHHEMVFDKRRTAAYYHAISKSKNIFKDKVVLDVGCGTGILSCFVAKAGAKKVYAVDASDMAHRAELIVQQNGLSDIVTVFKGKLEHIAFPEYVDVIISEWQGSFLIFESMIESVIYARDNLMKAGGIILPSKASIYLSPINVESFYDQYINQWSNVFNLDMSPLIPFAQEELLEEKTIRNYYVDNTDSVLDKPIILRTIDLSTITIEELSKTVKTFEFKVPNGSKYHGFGAWFSVWFENLDDDDHGNKKSQYDENEKFVYYTIDRDGELVKTTYQQYSIDSKGFTPMFFEQSSNVLELSTAPGTGDQHWKQVLFLNSKEKILQSSDKQEDTTSIKGTIRILQNKDYRRHWWIEMYVSLKTKPFDYSYQKYLI
ncbi:hypothetical protein ACTA71_000899 [Dictyostelium dimigraforme]